jgi:hypothetical protein
VIEGIVDLAFSEKTADFAGWTVVDFKTDREFNRLLSWGYGCKLTDGRIPFVELSYQLDQLL